MRKRETERIVRRAVAGLGLETRKSSYWCYIPDDLSIKEVWRGGVTDSWLWSMMHEVGHHLLHRRGDYRKRFWRSSETSHHVVDKVSAVQVMKEEILAWDEGWKWAKSLGLEVDRERYDKYASRYLMEYMKRIPGQVQQNAWARSMF